MSRVPSRKRIRIKLGADSNRDAILNCYLNEYNSLSDEIKIRLNFSHKLLNIFILVIGAILAAFVQIFFVSESSNTSVFELIIFMTPLLTGPLIAFYIDNLMMIYKISNYLNSYLFIKIRSFLNEEGLFCWDDYHKRSSIKLSYVSVAKNVFFLIILTFPTFYYLPKKTGKNLIDFFLNFPDAIQDFLAVCNDFEAVIFFSNCFIILVVFVFSALNISIFLRKKSFVAIND